MATTKHKNDHYAKVFARNLRKLIHDDKLTTEDFADRMNLSVKGVNNYLSGRRLPKSQILIEIAGYFGVPVENLLKEDGAKMNMYSSTIVTELMGLKMADQIREIRAKTFSEIPTNFAAKQADLKALKEHFEGLFGTGKDSVKYTYVRAICMLYSENRRELKERYKL